MADYCDLCDLPLSNCIHGLPAPPIEPPPRSAAKPATRRSATKVAAPRKTATASATTTVPRRVTSPESLRPHILAVLAEAGGSLDGDEAYARLEARLGDTLLERDLTTTPQGELRWRVATRTARQSLIADGLLVPGPGQWRLS